MGWFSKFFYLYIVCSHCTLFSFSQNTDTLFAVNTDSVIVTAFNANKNYAAVPASIALLPQPALRQFLPNNILPIINTVAGVRMEERSPGSYRVSMRGSLLRSPFGVRNIKVYWNNIPLTDATGNTYFNLIEPAAIDNIEIIKGPASALYGLGTGGVILLNSKANNQNKVSVGTMVGSYGLLNNQVQIQQNFGKSHLQVLHAYTQHNGYREHTNLQKNTLQLFYQHTANKHTLQIIGFSTFLYYQTPGGLTFNQWLQNPTQARPATNTLPGAVEQKAAVYNNTQWVGLNSRWKINNELSWNNSIGYSITHFQNPFITNFEQRKEANQSFITALHQTKQAKNIEVKNSLGVELLFNQSFIDNYNNNKGEKGSVIFNDEVNMQQLSAFYQLQVSYKKIFLQAGLSVNEQWLLFNRLNNANYSKKESFTKPIIAPRLAINYSLASSLNLYAQIARGFSNPTLAEIRPSDGNFYNNLQPENGLNYELGVKSHFFNNTLKAGLSIYFFQLNNALVRQLNNNGAEYFVNAGSTKQNGVECTLDIKTNVNKVSGVTIHTATAYQPYKFLQYNVANNNYNGNKLTGVPRFTQNITINYSLPHAWLFTTLYNYVDAIPLNDANTSFANSYHLLQIKIAKDFFIRKYKLGFYMGIDNVLNARYSLGNDINAAGGRFFNVAPARNFFLGLNVAL
jgi:iron complex outermembrane receptor protein